MDHKHSLTNGHLTKSATWCALGVACLLIAAKAIGWILTDSLAFQASLVDSCLDALMSGINAWAVHQSLKPADSEHRFGRGKVEAIAGLGQSLLITVSALWLLKEAWHRLWHPHSVSFSQAGLYIMISASLATLLLVFWQKYVIRKTNSLAITADALHYETDLLTNIGVLISLWVSARWHFSWIDTLIGSAISGYIFFTSWEICKRSFHVLIDKELPLEIRNKITKTALSHPQVLGVHEVRTRSGGHKDFLQLHLDLDPNLTLREAHTISDEVMDMIAAQFPNMDILIHQDPLLEEREKTLPRTSD